MAPIHKTNPQNNQKRILRSTNNISILNKNEDKNEQKRKAESSPPKDKEFKRTAFIDITNAIGKAVSVVQDSKNISLTKKSVVPKPAPKVKPRVSVKATATVFERKSIAVTQPVKKTQVTIKRLPATKKPEVILIQKQEEQKSKPSVKKENEKKGQSPAKRRDEEKKCKSPAKKRDEEKQGTSPARKEDKEVKESVERQEKHEDSSRLSSDGSLYVSALEEISAESPQLKEAETKTEDKSPKPVLPPGINDFDKESLHDPIQVSLYAMDIFNYLKEREAIFKVPDYMDKQPTITPWVRSLLVDWMVEVQEIFEFNHETLYLAVKLVDLYLSKTMVTKEKLQLLGTAALFVACKFDEHPPIINDFLYLCDGAYTHNEMVDMEARLVKAVDFNLGMPLSYRFLRRYARCAKLSLPMLTLARYILELSLMEYSFVQASESKIAAASLLLALKMKLGTGWTPTLEYYSGYTVEDLKTLVHALNTMLHKKPREALATIRNKYSHKTFFEVANTPLVDELVL